MVKGLFQKIGLDRIVIKGFRIIAMNVKKLKNRDNTVLEESGENLYFLGDNTGFRKLKIDDNIWFGSLIAGTTVNKSGKHDYSRMDITIGNRETGNLVNMSVAEYKERVQYIFSYLYGEYGILIDGSHTKISQMEINCTIAIEEEFYKYHRSLELMLYNLPDYYSKIGKLQKANKKDVRLEAETYYRGNQSMQIKIYDKKKQLQDTRGCMIDENIMRIEFELKSASKIRTVFGSNELEELTQRKVCDFYIGQFRKLFEKKYWKWRKDNGNFLRKLIIDHKSKNPIHWQRNLLNECRNQEQKNSVPILLEIEDLLEQVRLLEGSGHYTRTEKAILNKCELDDVYLQRDSEKIEEILSKVNHIYLESTR